MAKDLLKQYQGKKVFITGHSGFKGGWLSAWLKLLGAQVMGYSLDIPTQPSFFDAVDLASQIDHNVGDIRDYKRLLCMMKAFAPDFVFHLAAQPLVRASYNMPQETFDINVMGTLNVLEVIRQVSSIKVGIIVTTDKCYENREIDHGYVETDCLGGYDPYSASKASAEIVTACFRQSFFNLQNSAGIATVRAGNVIGGGDWGEDRLVPDCVRALNVEKEIFIRNPLSVRPWQYVLDPLCGYLMLGALMEQSPREYSQAWNFGPSQGLICVQDIAKKVIRYWGSGKYRILEEEQKTHEARLLLLDAAKARKRLGWGVLYQMDEGLQRTIKWYKNFYEKRSSQQLWELTLQDITEYQEILNQGALAHEAS